MLIPSYLQWTQGGSDQSPLSGQASVITFSTVTGHWYYLVVGDFNAASTTYTLNVW